MTAKKLIQKLTDDFDLSNHVKEDLVITENGVFIKESDEIIKVIRLDRSPTGGHYLDLIFYSAKKQSPSAISFPIRIANHDYRQVIDVKEIIKDDAEYHKLVATIRECLYKYSSIKDFETLKEFINSNMDGAVYFPKKRIEKLFPEFEWNFVYQEKPTGESTPPTIHRVNIEL